MNLHVHIIYLFAFILISPFHIYLKQCNLVFIFIANILSCGNYFFTTTICLFFCSSYNEVEWTTIVHYGIIYDYFNRICHELHEHITDNYHPILSPFYKILLPGIVWVRLWRTLSECGILLDRKTSTQHISVLCLTGPCIWSVFSWLWTVSFKFFTFQTYLYSSCTKDYVVHREHSIKYMCRSTQL